MKSCLEENDLDTLESIVELYGEEIQETEIEMEVQIVYNKLLNKFIKEPYGEDENYHRYDDKSNPLLQLQKVSSLTRIKLPKNLINKATKAFSEHKDFSSWFILYEEIKEQPEQNYPEFYSALKSEVKSVIRTANCKLISEMKSHLDNFSDYLTKDDVLEGFSNVFSQWKKMKGAQYFHDSPDSSPDSPLEFMERYLKLVNLENYDLPKEDHVALIEQLEEIDFKIMPAMHQEGNHEIPEDYINLLEEKDLDVPKECYELMQDWNLKNDLDKCKYWLEKENISPSQKGISNLFQEVRESSKEGLEEGLYELSRIHYLYHSLNIKDGDLVQETYDYYHEEFKGNNLSLHSTAMQMEFLEGITGEKCKYLPKIRQGFTTGNKND